MLIPGNQRYHFGSYNSYGSTNRTRIILTDSFSAPLYRALQPLQINYSEAFLLSIIFNKDDHNCHLMRTSLSGKPIGAEEGRPHVLSHENISVRKADWI